MIRSILLPTLMLISPLAFAHDDGLANTPQDLLQLNRFADPRVTPTVNTDGPKSIGYYTYGCLDGAVSLVPDSPDQYEIMHPERRRYFGHPKLKELFTKISSENGKFMMGD